MELREALEILSKRDSKMGTIAKLWLRGRYPGEYDFSIDSEDTAFLTDYDFSTASDKEVCEALEILAERDTDFGHIARAWVSAPRYSEYRTKEYEVDSEKLASITEVNESS
ncbi:hypothetical protein ACFQL0_14540 [Haloplanus litoreus]